MNSLSELQVYHLNFEITENDTPLYYLATPISTKNPTELWGRYEDGARVLARLITGGYQAFCPITHWLTAGTQWQLPRTWSFWRPVSYKMLSICDALLVLKLEGWKQSEGVQAEIAKAKQLGLPIFYLPHSGDIKLAIRG